MLWILVSAHAATLTVGSGYSSIQAAIDAASDGDTVAIPGGTYDEAITVGDDLAIVASGSVTIRSSGSTAVSFENSNASLEGVTIEATNARAIEVEGGAPSFHDVTIDGAGSGALYGGALYVSGGSPTLTDVRFIDVDAQRGGAIYAEDGSYLSLTDVTIENATAYTGGAIYLQDSVLEFAGLDIDAFAENAGGGLQLRNSTFEGSDLTLSATGEATYGAGIYAREDSFVTIDGGTFEDCVASEQDNGYAGGAIYAEDSTELNLSDVRFVDNEAYWGAAIALDDDAVATIVGGDFQDNVAMERGGALGVEGQSGVSCEACSFSGNVAGHGGAVFLEDADYVDVGSSFEGNIADSGSGSASAEGMGGAVFASGSGLLAFEGTSFTSNEADLGGGALALEDLDEEVVVDTCAFDANETVSGDGGAIAAGRDVTLTISGTSFNGDEALAGNGGAIAFDPSDDDHVLTLSETSFLNQSADDAGGAVYAESGDVLVHDTTAQQCYAGSFGGALAFVDVDELELRRVELFGNVAADGGGGVYEEASTSADVRNVVLVENEAAYGGGAAIVAGVGSVWWNNTFVGNDASAAGGQVYVAEGYAELVSSIFYLAVDGGGVYGDSTAAASSDLYYNDVYDNAGGDYAGDFEDPTGESGNLDLDPDLRDYASGDAFSAMDLRLNVSSPCVDGGHPSEYDPDGSVSDIGAYGGEDADVQDLDGDGWYDSLDCDDEDATINPDEPETPYDGIDQDCDGDDLIDVDGDGYDADVVGGDDCDDDEADVYPGASDAWYDGVDADCAEDSDYDADGDGFDHDGYGGEDCDDTDGAIHPDAAESWYDGIDGDCDGLSDFDADRDGHEAEAYGGSDCNDAASLTYPGAPEIAYDGFDQDCDGQDLTDLDGDGYDGGGNGIDCDDTNPEVYPGADDDPYDGLDSNCDGQSEYDSDGDGYDSDAFGGPDCDDDNPEVNPGAVEHWYDGIDGNCNGDDDYDADRDGYPSDEHGGTDCDDSDATAHPGSWDTWYDGIDQDCAGDDDFDRDRDGWRVDEDCDDSRDEAYPGADEVWNSMDDDCDGWSEDEDRDYDGLIDWYEWAFGTDQDDPDSDGDGLADGLEVPDPESGAVDTDFDGAIDPLDDDDDDDGLPTAVEAFEDADGDNVLDRDVDGDGLWNHRDLDSDGDGYLDRDEGAEDTDLDGVPEYLDYTGDFAGGGCAGGFSGLLSLVFVGGLFRRRTLMRAFPVALAALFAVITVAPAQAEGLDAHGFQLLGSTGDVLHYSRLAYPDGGLWGDLDAGIVADHAFLPLTEELPEGREAVISQLATTNLMVSASLGARSRLELVAPVHPIAVGVDGTASGLGDIRLGSVVPAWKPDAWKPGLAIAPSVWLPTGNEAQFMGTPGVSGGGVITIAGEHGRFGWVANAGARVGRMEAERNAVAGAGPLAGLGAHYAVTDAVAVTWETTVQGATGWADLPLESLLSGRVRLKRGLFAVAGGSVGLSDAVGAAKYRAILGVGWSKRAPELDVFVATRAAPAVDPDADRDGDGIRDVEDLCPDQPETFDTFEDDDGCPELDGDQDGVTFEDDLCPTEAIYPEQDPRYSDGCPKLAELSGDKIIITDGIFFREASAEILERSAGVLEAVYWVLMENPQVEGILVEGHTNDNGSVEYNYELSEDRARAVERWLIRRGLDRNRVFSKGYGEDVPLVEHDHRDAKRINRRVEFTVVSLDESEATLPSERLLPAE